MKKRAGLAFKSAVVLICLVGLWQALVSVYKLPPYILPPYSVK